ncbi:hypothetical protein [Escherichia coli]|uniref:hypothetical protein n=1 Tax=Escherichia coli TaxID=562 RepID=UPI0039A01C03
METYGVWGLGSLKPAYSNNPAWCLWDMLTATRMTTRWLRASMVFTKRRYDPRKAAVEAAIARAKARKLERSSTASGKNNATAG